MYPTSKHHPQYYHSIKHPNNISSGLYLNFHPYQKFLHREKPNEAHQPPLPLTIPSSPLPL